MANSNFNRLLGVWQTTGTIYTHTGTVAMSGTDSYELILDGKFILHKAKVTMGGEQSETIEMIKLDADEKASMYYFNNNGENGVMQGSIKGQEFTIEGESLNFCGIIGHEDKSITGDWFQKNQDGGWERFISLRLEKR